MSLFLQIPMESHSSSAQTDAVCLFLPLERPSLENGTLHARLLSEQLPHYCIPSWLELLDLSLLPTLPSSPSFRKKKKGVQKMSHLFLNPAPSSLPQHHL